MNFEFGLGTVLAAVGGALLAGAGRLASDWWQGRSSRSAYITAIKTETNTLCQLIESQNLKSHLSEILNRCEQGGMPTRVPTFDFHSNYFSCFESLGAEIRFLNEVQCKAVVEFYLLMKAGFDTVRKDGPLAGYADVNSLAQACRFMLSLIDRCSVLNREIQSFSSSPWPKWWK